MSEITKKKGTEGVGSTENYAPKQMGVIDGHNGVDDEQLAKAVAVLEKTDAWVKEMKKRISVDPTDDDILLINDGIQVDKNGDVTIGRDLFVEDEVVIDGLDKIVDPNGEPIIPDASGHLKEALAHISTGYAWYKGYELAGFQVVKKSEFEGGSFVKHTHIIYFVWNDTAGASYGEVYVRYYEA